MTAFLFVCVVFSAVVAIGLSALLVVERLRARRLRGCRTLLQRRYLHIVMSALCAEKPSVPRFPLLRRAGSRLLLAETLAGVATLTYGLPVEPLQKITARYRLDEWLLRRAHFALGCRRARYLALLSALPVRKSIAERAARYGRSRNRYVRFYALMVALAAEPPAALRRMGACGWPFSTTEVAEITATLRRGMLPVAYRPLVASPSPNLRRVGLSIVRQFGIEEAEPLLLELLAGHAESEADILYTLCALRRPLVRREVRDTLRRMNPGERRALIRYMARSSYAPGELQRLFDRSECSYYAAIVRSHKRCLA